MVTDVFYSPHSDDETIGMAGSIIRAKAADRRVVAVLVTDNRASARALGRFPDFAGDLTAARIAEWRQAMRVLEVDECRYMGLPETIIAADRSYAVAALLGFMSAIDHEFGDGGGDVVHHTVMGSGDIHRELGRSTQAHRLCEEAARLFARSNPLVDVFLHAVYIYSFPRRERGAPIILELTPDELATKCRALDAYKAGGDRIGYGYDSVPDLIDGAYHDPREYMCKL